MKKIVLALMLALSVAANAEDVDVVGGTVSTSNMVSHIDYGENGISLVFTKNGTFTIPKYAKARVVAVGGGGAGGSVPSTAISGVCGGGGGGGVADRELILESGEYSVSVGLGGHKVETSVQYVVGENGQDSIIALNGETVLVAKGGGGGGTPRSGGNGADGASGGGGCIFNNGLSVNPSGKYVDGQGWGGGIPSSKDIGGGGGGANLDSDFGKGGSDGKGGLGRELDIQGELAEYGRGGNGGGLTNLLQYASYGNGGNGGTFGIDNGMGCSGLNGIVVVQIRKLFDMTEVGIPSSESFKWSNGSNIVGFNPSSELRNAIDHIEGITNVVCSMDGSVTNGLGRFNYIVHLKDEYQWSDGTSTPKSIHWRVVDPNSTGTSAIEVSKSVRWSEGSEAIIEISIKTKPEMMERIPNVLFLGSLCTSHGFSVNVLRTAINTVLNVGNIDYYLFAANSSNTSPNANYSGSLLKGSTYNGNPSMKTGNHEALYGFYEYAYRAMNSGKNYDYVIFSFDRALVSVGMLAGSHPHESEVSEWMSRFYDSNAVIWLVDNSIADDNLHNISQTPWYPSQLVYYLPKANYGSGERKWGSLYEYMSDRGRNNAYSDSFVAYKAMIGMFSPDKYGEISDSLYRENYSITSSDAKTKVSNLAGSLNPNQVVYDDASNVEDLIKKIVKPRPMTMVMNDKVVDSLDIIGTSGCWTTNESLIGWIDIESDQVQIDGTKVRLAIPDIQDDAEFKFYINVDDSKSEFRNSINAIYNERTGLLEKDPNDGKVTASMQSESGEIVVDSESSTEVSWSFPFFNIKGEVVHGQGEIALNGFIVNSVDVAEGSSPSIVFRGKGGYVVDYLEVDGQEIQVSPSDYSYSFMNVGTDHEIKVGFKNSIKEYPTISPRIETYDGTPYAPMVDGLEFLDGCDCEWKVVYSTDGINYSETNGIVNVQGETKMYAKIMLLQEGYDEWIPLEGWVGESTVTILPREIVVRFNDAIQTNSTSISKFSWEIVDGELVEGDYFNDDDGKCTRYPSKGSSTYGTVTAKNEMFVITPNTESRNYIVSVMNGDYHYPDTELIANAPDVVKVYDGIPTSTVANVIYPIDAKTTDKTMTQYGDWSSNKRTATLIWSELTIIYDETGNSTPPTYIDSSTNIVGYTVNYVVHSATVTQSRSRKNWSSPYTYTTTTGGVNTVTYTPYVGSATVTILPRTITVSASDAEKMYDGNPLTCNEYVVDGEFAEGEGIESVSMCSSIVDVGSCDNIIDSVTLMPNTKQSNYEIRTIDGTLTINGGTALMIIDHRSSNLHRGFVELKVKVQHAESSIDEWFKNNYNGIRAKSSICIDNLEESALNYVEVLELESESDSIWIRVPYDTTSTNFYARAFCIGGGSAVPWRHSNGVDALDFTSGDGVESINIHAMVKVQSPSATNILVAVPWTWYSERESDATQIPTSKLVSPLNLESGCVLLQFLERGKYASWMLDSSDGWLPIDVLSISDPKMVGGKMLIEADNSLTSARGSALWVGGRKLNLDSPIWLYGQYCSSDCTTSIKQSPADDDNKSIDCTSNPIGNPFNVEISINEMKFNGEIDKDDRIWVPDGTVTGIYLMWNQKANGWCYSKIDPKTRRTTYVTDIKVRQGLGFWYDRRGTSEMTIEWHRGEKK